MGIVKVLFSLVPRSMEAQMVSVLAISLLVLFAALMVLEVRGHETAIETAQSPATSNRLQRLYPVLDSLREKDLGSFMQIVSSCHEGYVVTAAPFRTDNVSPDAARLRSRLALELSLPAQRVLVGQAHLVRGDFSYDKCSGTEIDLPLDGVVISVQLASGQWLNREVHPHEWHFREKIGWMLRASAAFAFVGGIAIFFIHRLSRPLNSLTDAARRFGAGLKVSKLMQAGPADVRRAIDAFNEMQQRVADEVERRTDTLAAISHDIRTPLTALRVRSELVADTELRQGLISSIDRMERITASALEFLRGQSRSEPLRTVDLSALLESECVDFEETGRSATFVGEHNVVYTCRPEALARAVRNLIDNAVKYGQGATVVVRTSADSVSISVSDEGPGIPTEQWESAFEPFGRLSPAREDNQGGFGLGLSIAKAVAQGHDGELILEANRPTGLIAILRLPLAVEH